MTTTAAGQTIRDDIEVLPVVRAHQLESVPPEQRWLVDTLWSAEGVGVIGAHPKSAKTWLGLELAVSIASGKPCLGRFEVKKPGPVLFYLAEDNAHATRDRLNALCQHHQVDLASLELLVIAVASLTPPNALGGRPPRQPHVCMPSGDPPGPLRKLDRIYATNPDAGRATQHLVRQSLERFQEPTDVLFLILDNQRGADKNTIRADPRPHGHVAAPTPSHRRDASTNFHFRHEL